MFCYANAYQYLDENQLPLNILISESFALTTTVQFSNINEKSID